MSAGAGRGSHAARPAAAARRDPRSAPRRRPAAGCSDRDGTLNEAVADPASGAPESPLSVEQVRLLPGAPAAARRLRDAGYALVCVTNQPAAAKGKATLDRAAGRSTSACSTCWPRGGRAGRALAPVPPPPRRSSRPSSRARCACRKPAPGMLIDAAAELASGPAAPPGCSGTRTPTSVPGARRGAARSLIDYPAQRTQALRRRGRPTSAPPT